MRAMGCALLGACVLGGLTWPVQAQPTQVVVVRHAEKSGLPADDPDLSPEGQARAQALARLLQPADVSTIIVTSYRRTQQTAAPLASQQGVTPWVIAPGKGGMAVHVQQVVEAVNRASGVVLVVGHSNTVPAIVAALSRSRPGALCETSFSHLFVLTPPVADAPALHLRYGVPDAPAQEGCL